MSNGAYLAGAGVLALVILLVTMGYVGRSRPKVMVLKPIEHTEPSATPQNVMWRNDITISGMITNVRWPINH